MATQQMDRTKVTVRTLILVGIIVFIIAAIIGMKMYFGGKYMKAAWQPKAGAPQTVSTTSLPSSMTGSDSGVCGG